MQLLKFMPIKLTFFLVTGILVGKYLNIPILFPLLSCIFFLIMLGALFRLNKTKNTEYFGITTFLLTFCVGLLTITIANPKNDTQHYSKFAINDPQSIELKISEVLKPNNFSTRYICEVQNVANQTTTGKILLTIAKDSSTTDLNVDDEFIVFDQVVAVRAPLNPHQFNYKKYLADLGVLGQIQLKKGNFIKTTHPTKTIFGLAANFRESIITSLKTEKFGADELSIVQALLLGQRNDISEDTYDNYKDAGAVHILAVSGLHIGILLLLLQFLLQPLGRLPHGNKIKLALLVVLLWTFAFIAGLSASVVRAVTMFSFLAYAMYLNRPANRFNILALSLFFILLLKPQYIFQVGFQMSYAAVFAIIWIYPKLQRFWYPKPVIGRKIWQLLSVSIAAQLGVLPVSLFYFHQFPSLFFISNLLIVPCLGLILGGGIVVILLSILGILPDFITSLYNDIIGLMNLVIYWVAQQESFVFKAISFDGMQLALSYMLIFSLVFALSKPSFKKFALFLGGILLLQAWSIFQVYKTNQKEYLIVLHQTKNTGILEQKGSSLKLWTNQPNSFDYAIAFYTINEKIMRFNTDSLANSYTLKVGNLYVVDSLAIYPPKEKRYDFVLLTQSPKINLERFIEATQPKIIIADGSNYNSDLLRWQATCVKRKLPFHYTGEKGAYYFSLSNLEASGLEK